MLDIKNIDTWVINLDKTPEKYKEIIKRFKELGIVNIKRFSAVNGKDLDAKYVDKICHPYVAHTIKNGRNLDCEIATPGALGCYLSHVRLWEMLLRSNKSMFFILEDDAEPITKFSLKDINKFLNDVETQDKNWDIIFLGCAQHLFVKDIEITDNVFKIQNITYQTHAYIISRNGAAKLLKGAFPIIHQLDSYISFMSMYRDVNNYRSKEDYISQDHLSETSIQTDSSLKILLFRMSEKYVKIYAAILMGIFIFLLVLIIFLSMKK